MVGGGREGGGGRGGANAGHGGAGRGGFRQSGLCQPAEPTAERGGSQNELVPCSQTQRAPWDLVGATKPGSVSPALFHGEKERLNRNCSTDSRS